jgi:hypothetical protein
VAHPNVVPFDVRVGTLTQTWRSLTYKLHKCKAWRPSIFRGASVLPLRRTSPKVISSRHLCVSTLEVSPQKYPISGSEASLD